LRVSDSTKDNVISLKSEGRGTGVLFDKEPQQQNKQKRESSIPASLVNLIDIDD